MTKEVEEQIDKTIQLAESGKFPESLEALDKAEEMTGYGFEDHPLHWKVVMTQARVCTIQKKYSEAEELLDGLIDDSFGDTAVP